MKHKKTIIGLILMIFAALFVNAIQFGYDGNERVGIGTNTPTVELDIYQDVENTVVAQVRNTAGQGVIQQYTTANGDGYFAIRNGSGTLNILLNARDGQNSYLDVSSYFGINTNSPNSELEVREQNAADTTTYITIGNSDSDGRSDLNFASGTDLDVGRIRYRHRDDLEYFELRANATNIGYLNPQTSGTPTLFLEDLTAAGGDPLCWDGSGGSYIGDCSSLEKYKEDVTYVTIDVMDKFKELKPAQFNWKQSELAKDIKYFDEETNLTLTKENKIYDHVEYGFLAEDVEAVSPRLVGYDEQGNLKNVRWFNLITFIVKTLQEVIETQEQNSARLDAIEQTLCNQGASKYC